MPSSTWRFSILCFFFLLCCECSIWRSLLEAHVLVFAVTVCFLLSFVVVVFGLGGMLEWLVWSPPPSLDDFLGRKMTSWSWLGSLLVFHLFLLWGLSRDWQSFCCFNTLPPFPPTSQEKIANSCLTRMLVVVSNSHVAVQTRPATCINSMFSWTDSIFFEWKETYRSFGLTFFFSSLDRILVFGT